MNDIVGHVVVRSTEKDSYWNINQMMDFSGDWEVALLAAHVEYRPDDEQLAIQFRSTGAGTANVYSGPHTVRTAADLVGLITLGVGSFRHAPVDAPRTPFREVLNVTLIGKDKIRLTLLPGTGACSMALLGDYTRANIGGGNATLTAANPTHVLDLTAMRKTVNSIDIELGDMLRDDTLLQSIPLADKDGYHVHYEPHTLVYKEVTASQFGRIPIRYKFNCSNNCEDCTRLLRGTVVLSFRRK